MIYRCTGPPEHWLTTVEKFVWGVNRVKNNQSQWKKLSKGDIIFFHSTKSNRKNVVGSPSIIGYGVVERTYIKNGFFWLTEFEENKNIWPYVILFSEISFFSDISKIKRNPIENKTEKQIIEEINLMLKDSIPLRKINDETGRNFPVNGSISGFSNENSKIIDYLNKFLGKIQKNSLSPEKNKNFFNLEAEDIYLEVEKESYTEPSITEPNIKSADIKFIPSEENELDEESFQKQYTKDERKLKKANRVHQNLVNFMINYLNSKKLKTWEDKSGFDLATIKGENLILFEMKSKNDLSNIRRAVGQLFYYEFFKIKGFDKFKGKNIKKFLVLEKRPNEEYMYWLDHIGISTIWVSNDKLKYFGKNKDFIEN
jgi:hypothetical protein